MTASERTRLFRQHRAVLIAAAREYSAKAYAANGYPVLPLLRKANSYVRAAREMNRQFISHLKSLHGTQRELF